MATELKITEARVVEILKQHFDVFKLAEVPGYKKILHDQAYLDNTESRLRQLYEKHKRLFINQLPCPIPECKGSMVEHDCWGWVCSIGGLRHRVAKLLIERGWKAEEIIPTLTTMYQEKMQLIESERQAWKEGMNRDEAIPLSVRQEQEV
jgi:hypothetical protein